MRTAKSRGPDAPTLASSSREASFLGATVARKPGHRGEREVSRKPSRRESRIASAEPVCSCAFFCACLHTRPRVQRAPGFPCALCSRAGAKVKQSSGGSRRENADACSYCCLTIESENLFSHGLNFAPAGGGGLGWGAAASSHCSRRESFPHPPRSSSAATSPASGRGEARRPPSSHDKTSACPYFNVIASPLRSMFAIRPT